MEIQLIPKEVEELRRIQKKEKFHRRRFIKATVLLMLHQGVSLDVICASLSLGENTVYRYAKAFRERDRVGSQMGVIPVLLFKIEKVQWHPYCHDYLAIGHKRRLYPRWMRMKNVSEGLWIRETEELVIETGPSPDVDTPPMAAKLRWQ